jgi:hypothetical protein
MVRTLRRLLLTVCGVILSSHASAVPAPNAANIISESDLSARVERVRNRLINDLHVEPSSEEAEKLSQWYNWPNWPNYWRNFWRNY